MTDNLSQASIVSQLHGPTSRRLQWSVETLEQSIKGDNGASLLEMIRSPYFKGLEILPSPITAPKQLQSISEQSQSKPGQPVPGLFDTDFPTIPTVLQSTPAEPRLFDALGLTPSTTPKELQHQNAPKRNTPSWLRRMEILENITDGDRQRLLKERQEGFERIRQELHEHERMKPIPLDKSFIILPGHPNWPAIMAAKKEMQQERERERNRKKRAPSVDEEDDSHEETPNKRQKKEVEVVPAQQVVPSASPTQPQPQPQPGSPIVPMQTMLPDGSGLETKEQEGEVESQTNEQPATQPTERRVTRRPRAPKGTVLPTRRSRRLAGQLP